MTVPILPSANAVKHEFGDNLRVLTPNDQIHELQTIIRDKYEYFEVKQLF